MSDKKISEAVIRRLPRYYRQLQELNNKGIERISSAELAEAMALNASQIRQDLNCFGGFGQQGYGYQVDVLLNEVASILGLVQDYKAIIIGAGNIGHALAGYSGFAKYRFEILAAFDCAPDKIGGRLGNVAVHPVEELEAFIRTNHVTIAIVAVPKAAVQEVCARAVGAGVKAIWNFAPADVVCPEAQVENVRLNDSLFVLTYRLAHSS